MICNNLRPNVRIFPAVFPQHFPQIVKVAYIGTMLCAESIAHQFREFFCAR